MYNTDLGRMPQADPLVTDASDPQSYNAYSYVINNPANYTDPTGMFIDFSGLGLDRKAALEILRLNERGIVPTYGPPPTPSQCGPKCVTVRGKLYPVRRGLDLEGYSFELHYGAVLGYGAPGVLKGCYLGEGVWIQCPRPTPALARVAKLLGGECAQGIAAALALTIVTTAAVGSGTIFVQTGGVLTYSASAAATSAAAAGAVTLGPVPSDTLNRALRLALSTRKIESCF